MAGQIVEVDYMTNRSSLIGARGASQKISFELSDSEGHAYRFTRSGGGKLALMVADYLPSRMEPRLGRRPVFSVPAVARLYVVGSKSAAPNETKRTQIRTIVYVSSATTFGIYGESCLGEKPGDQKQ